MCENPNESSAEDANANCCVTFQFPETFHTVFNEQIEKSHWNCDYADEIFQTLRETELRRYLIGFRSQQTDRLRPALINLLKVASEKYNLARTTLHLAAYFLDCFMDNFTIRQDKLNLTALTCLMLAAKIEEADVNMPKFAKLNELSGGNYTLDEFKNVESKILSTFHFDLMRPTVATFAEHFARNCLTLDDFHVYMRNWHSKATVNYQELQTRFTKTTESAIHPACLLPPLYNSYEEMVTALSKMIFSLADMSLNYFKFANVRPSILAASCIAAVRQLQGKLQLWTPYLMVVTECTADEVLPYVDALITLYNLQLATSNAAGCSSCKEEEQRKTNVLCDSPDSGISISDTKSNTSADDSLDENEDDENEYPLLAKRRRLF